MKPNEHVFFEHSRRWRGFEYVYPVISRRSRGLSIGINLSPDAACSFDCVYCQVDRTVARDPAAPDLAVIEAELRALLATWQRLFDEPEFRHTPPDHRRLNDIAFSGDGEPTASPAFSDAARLAAGLRAEFKLTGTRIVVITNACFLDRPVVAESLALLDANNGEIWAKLDAGSEERFREINRCRFTLQHILDNIVATARLRPIVIQSLFMRLHGAPPERREIDAYVDRLRRVIERGGQIARVQVYTVARRPAELFVSPLSGGELEGIAAAVRPLGVAVECYV